MIPIGTCECCHEEPAVGVASLPAAPMSIAWCRKCLLANVVPYKFAVTQTAMLGGSDGTAQWWKDTVARTLSYFGKSETQFAADVAEAERDAGKQEPRDA